ncbi:MAG: PAS domain S-box protein [Desulfobacterales bacterium]|nr:PAS domain S-box protein [Desulfobacterales bacterium]
MNLHTRSQTDRRIIAAVVLATIIFLTLGARLDMWLLDEMRSNARQQFNQQQLVIARNIQHEIERRLEQIKDEIRILGEVVAGQNFNAKNLNTDIQKSFKRIRENGVYRIDLLNPAAGPNFYCLPGRSAPLFYENSGSAGHRRIREKIRKNGELWISKPAYSAKEGFQMLIGRRIPSVPPGHLVFHIRLRQLFSPFLPHIRSGQTGYAWIINGAGRFLYHPESAFIGKSAYTAREKRRPVISFEKINAIQRNKMLEGKEGTGSYVSGWHRERQGEIEKLIAYCPIRISNNPEGLWSVAVVAPTAEIEAYISQTHIWRVLLQGTIIGLLVFAAGTIFFLEMKWNRVLEDRVKERTEELKKSEEKYRSLVESAEDFIFTVDARGRFQSMNSFTANFFGGHAEDYIGEGLERIIPRESAQKQREMLALVFKHKKSVRDEFRIPVGDHHEIWLSANFMPIKDKADHVSTVLCIARDVTETKNIERQLINTEKLAALGTLAAGVAHEINNPLGVILGFCDLLGQEMAAGSQAYEDLKTIERQGYHCKQIIENLLSFARLGEDSDKSSDLNLCLQEIFEIVRHTLEMGNIELKADLAEHMPPVKGGARELQQVFLNLINNACAAMKTGGVLTIRTRIDRVGKRAVLLIKDTGTGIPARHLDHIFEPFYTTKPEGEGTGLGLSVSYGIIAKYGGYIDCVSYPAGDPDIPADRRGTVFIIKLSFDDKHRKMENGGSDSNR